MIKEFSTDDLIALNPGWFTERLGTMEFVHEPTGITWHCRVPSTGELSHLYGEALTEAGQHNPVAYHRMLVAFFTDAITPPDGEKCALAKEPARLDGKMSKRLPDGFLNGMGLGVTTSMGARLDMLNRLTDVERVRLRFFGGSEDSPEPVTSATPGQAETPAPESPVASASPESLTAEAAPA